MSHSDKCSRIDLPKVKEFKFSTIHYCPECYNHVEEENICVHDNIYVKFIIANDAIQVNAVCKKCFYKQPNPEPHSKFDLSKLPEKKNSEYRDFYDNLVNSDRKDTQQFKMWLIEMQHELYKDAYHEYLSSDAWQNTRKNILARDENTCQICGSKARDVHHLTYVNVGHEYYFELVSLCGDCHKTYHPTRESNTNHT